MDVIVSQEQIILGLPDLLNGFSTFFVRLVHELVDQQTLARKPNQVHQAALDALFPFYDTADQQTTCSPMEENFLSSMDSNTTSDPFVFKHLHRPAPEDDIISGTVCTPV